MKLQVQSEVRALFPELRIGIVTFDALVVVVDDAATRAADAFLDDAIAEAVERVRQTAPDAAAVSALPMVHAWREAYRRFGANPNRLRVSSEALLRRVVKGDAVRRISPLVDLYNLATLRSHLPIGGYDLDALRGDVVLRLSTGGEPFVGIGSNAPELTEAGEVVYSDDARVLTRNWNYRDADATKIERSSRRVALFVEAPYEAIPDDALESVLAFLRDDGARLLGAVTKVTYLGRHDTERAF